MGRVIVLFELETDRDKDRELLEALLSIRALSSVSATTAELLRAVLRHAPENIASEVKDPA